MTTLHRAARERFTVELTLNGQRRSGEAEPRMLLCDFLRHELQAFGVHVGCEHGVCGACTILVASTPMVEVLTPAVRAQGVGRRSMMTCIVGVQDDKGAWVGVDSLGSDGWSQNKPGIAVAIA